MNHRFAVLLALAWSALASPAHAEPMPLSRDQAIAQVLAHNPDLESARQALAAARTRPEQIVLPDPVLSWGVAPGSLVGGSLSTRVDLRQGLPFPGTIEATAASLEASAEAVEADVLAFGSVLALEAARLYDRLAWTRASDEVLVQHLALLDELRVSVEVRYATAATLALALAEVDVARAHVEHRRMLLASGGRQALVALNALMGQDPELVVLVEALSEPPGLAGQAELRPELVAARERVRSAEHHQEVVRLDSLPSFAVSGTYNSMWMSPKDRWMVGVAVEVPLHAAARGAEIEEAEALVARAGANSDALELTLRAEALQAEVRYDEALDVLSLYEQRLMPSAELSVELARSAFEAGSVDFDVLIDAERTLRDTEIDRLTALATAWTAQAELKVARGGQP